MHLPSQIAKQLRDLTFGGNWTWSSLKEQLSDISWELAIKQAYNCHSIAALVYHMNFYLNAVSGLLAGKPLDSKHELSFNVPNIQSQKDWEQLLDITWQDAEVFARLIEEMPESKLWQSVSDEYGNFYRNIQGVIEHNHYHLGQIVILKKILKTKVQ